MFYKLAKSLDKKINLPTASAHCDIPCKIYDPISAQISVLTMIRMVDLIEELQQSSAKKDTNYFNTMIRLVNQKEEICIIWGDYIKHAQIEKFPEIHELVHGLMLKISHCKQKVDKQASLELLDNVNLFADFFWETKGVSTYRAVCPYPPQLLVVYPKLS